MRRWLAAIALALLPFSAKTAPAAPASVRVVIATDLGNITVALDLRHAPITAGNFLRYVDEKRYDGTSFYRTVRGRDGLVQGGVDNDIKRTRLPIAHEPTTLTHLRHIDGTLSMARNEPGSAAGNFFIVIGLGKQLDAAPGYVGYAAFGQVVAGMGVVKRIQAQPTYPGGFSADMMGQTMSKRVKILGIRRAG